VQSTIIIFGFAIWTTATGEEEGEILLIFKLEGFKFVLMHFILNNEFEQTKVFASPATKSIGTTRRPGQVSAF